MASRASNARSGKCGATTVSNAGRQPARHGIAPTVPEMSNRQTSGNATCRVAGIAARRQRPGKTGQYARRIVTVGNRRRRILVGSAMLPCARTLSRAASQAVGRDTPSRLGRIGVRFALRSASDYRQSHVAGQSHPTYPVYPGYDSQRNNGDGGSRRATLRDQRRRVAPEG